MDEKSQKLPKKRKRGEITLTNATIRGGAGFLGDSLAEALVKIGQTVTVLDNFPYSFALVSEQ